MEAQVEKKEAQPRLRDLSKAFAKRIVRLNQYLTQQIEPREEILSRNVTQSGTRIGATILKAEMSGSNEGFRQGISKALDEATETQYWLELLAESGYLTAEQSKSINDDLRHILNILWKIVKAKKKAAHEDDTDLTSEDQSLIEQSAPQVKKRGRKPRQIMLEASKEFLIILLMSFSLLASSCFPSQEESESIATSKQLVSVTVFFGGFDIVQSRSSDKTATDAGITNIDLKVFDSNGNTVATATQTSADTDFGAITFQLSADTYSFVAVASNGQTSSTITSAAEATFPENANVYSCVQSETISANDTQSVTLDMGKRRNAIFRVKITDDTPSAVDAIQLIFSPSKTSAASLSFDPSTGYAASTWKFERTFTKAAFSITTFTDKLLAYYLLPTVADQQIEVTINALSVADAQTGQRTVLYTRTLTDVSIAPSTQTTASGTFFSSQRSGTFLFDTSIENANISIN